MVARLSTPVRRQGSYTANKTTMETERISHKVPDGNFIQWVRVHLSYSANTVTADVYAAEEYDGGVWYSSGSISSSMHRSFNDDCKLLMTITSCWRGTWDERMYPKETEFWIEEVPGLGRISESLRPVLRQLAAYVFDRPEWLNDD